uniref:Reverse transcriptase zinc-binding domain-containing protein n=2 Tax=Aegilops tauschii subsp. strangulata TaxID=200361 RepID=A0A453EDN5_AEGTS
MMRHLLLECPFARQTWHEVLAWLGMTNTGPNEEDTLMAWWLHAKHNTPTQMRKGLASIAFLTPWMIWKQRNECIFDGAQPLVHALVSKIKDEAGQWTRAGAHGLRVILPTTWDVH